MRAIIHLSIHNTKGGYAICIINKKLYCITIIQRLTYVIIDADVFIFEIVMFPVLIQIIFKIKQLHVADFGHWKFISLSHNTPHDSRCGGINALILKCVVHFAIKVNRVL